MCEGVLHQMVCLRQMEDIFELGTTVENYGKYYRTTRKSMAGQDLHDRLSSRYRTDSNLAGQTHNLIHIVTHKCVLHPGFPIQTSTDGIAGCSMEGLLS